VAPFCIQEMLRRDVALTTPSAGGHKVRPYTKKAGLGDSALQHEAFVCLVYFVMAAPAYVTVRFVARIGSSSTSMRIE